MASNMQVATIPTKTLTRSASASNMSRLSTHISKSDVSSLQRDYTLNKTKALEKKNLSCSKEHMKCSRKSGDNLVLEFSTAAYELARTCLDTVLTNESFQHAYEKRESVDNSGAFTDSCYKIFNRRADGSCGKKLKFVINLYHTTSQILVNGHKVDVFLTDIYEVLCKEMKSRCEELDIMNLNISTVINSEISKPQPNNELHIPKPTKNVSSSIIQDLQAVQNSEIDSDDEIDVCEICPTCQQHAYGKTVQCGECGEWYHLDCLDIAESSMQTLGEDDFVCQVCSDNLIYENLDNNNLAQPSSKQDIMNSSNEPAVVEVLSVTPQDTINLNNDQRNPSPSLNSHSSDINSQLSSSQVDKSAEINDISTKNKPKRVTKSNKIKKEDIQDKSYIMELENQIGILKSTIDLYKKTNEQRKNQNFSTDSTCSRDHTASESCKVEPSCTHKCYSDLADKIQENRLRAIETQMMQNMYISNAIHINLATQIRNSYSQIPPTYVEPSRYNGYSAPLPYYWPHAAYQNIAGGYQPYRPMAQPQHYTPQSGSVNTPILPNMGVRPPAFYQHQSPPVHYQHLGHTIPPHQPTGQIYQQPYAFPPAPVLQQNSYPQIPPTYVEPPSIPQPQVGLQPVPSAPDVQHASGPPHPNLSLTSEGYKGCTTDQQRGATAENIQRHNSTAKRSHDTMLKQNPDGRTNPTGQKPSFLKPNNSRPNNQHSRKRQYHNSSLGNSENLSLSGYPTDKDKNLLPRDKENINGHTPVKKCTLTDEKKSNLDSHAPDLGQLNCPEPLIVDITSPQKEIPATDKDTSSENFLSIPPVKHDPPELLKIIQQEEARESV